MVHLFPVGPPIAQTAGEDRMNFAKTLLEPVMTHSEMACE
jgi:hypothetical protein